MEANHCQKEIFLGELCRRAGIKVSDAYRRIAVCGLTSDSRRVQSGYLFIAINGRSTSVESHIREATERGACAVAVEEHVSADISVPIVCLDNARERAARLFYAWYFREDTPPRLIGVTGTNGKTTTASMIFHIFNFCGERTGMIGTLGAVSPDKIPYGILPFDSRANMTTPDPEELYAILRRMKDDGARYAVMEVSSHALVSGRVAPLSFEAGIFTNLTPEHLDMHGDIDSYYFAKRSLFDKVKTAIINADDRYGRLLLSDAVAAKRRIACHGGVRTTYTDCLTEFGIFADCAAAEQIKEIKPFGNYEYLMVTPTARVRLNSRLPGRYNVMNSMQAALAAVELGLSPSEIRRANACFEGVSGRLERVDIPDRLGFSVYIDYAHTPDALENLLVTAKSLRRGRGRIILLFGCGGDRDRSKRREMAHIASRMADMTVITSDNSRSEDPEQIIADILSGIDKHSTYATVPDRAEAIRYAVGCARQGDVILLAGKGHEQYEIDKSGKHPFSERDIVQKAAKRLAADAGE
ncbi:MAG: UDP-N-acetylmuramoyl-L-alanyl-D-glutamate--2,6-diaminopimelate ligase [Ruminococcaceae bacterium]|nr:UDP-N-acetylmuramoyl-L-alanyl-D-glutamate--2,6-diaminopimelate ligase [Oscillospiraceae bacterium]